MAISLFSEILSLSDSVCASPVLVPIEERVRVYKKDHQCAHLMKVEGIITLFRHQVANCESSIFEVSGHKWKLILYPMGKNSPKNHLSLYVKIKDTDSLPANWVVNVNLRLFALNLREAKWKKVDYPGVSFTSSNTVWGEENLLSFKELGDARFGYIVKNTSVFGVEITRAQQSSPRNIPRRVGTAECLKIFENPTNSKFTWKITKFSRFNEAKHFSHPFVIGQRKWRIEIYPKGVPDGNGKWLHVFLTAFDYIENAPKAKTYAKFKLRVLDQLYGEHRECQGCFLFSDPHVGFELQEFVSLKELHDQSKGFLTDDTIYIGVEFEVVSATYYI